MQMLRSLIFVVSMYLMMPLMAVVFFPFALFSKDWAIYACRSYTNYVIWTARWMIGLKVEVRGTPPTEAALVAAKHQSFFDIIIIYNAMPRPRFIMKRILLFSPILGQYAWRIGCVPVNRGKRGAAIEKMLADVEKGDDDPGQLVIYPQGTRVAPGATRAYKVGTAALYEQMNQPCVPVAANVGVFWPKRGIFRKPGTAIVEFLDPIPPGLAKSAFMERLESTVEGRSNALMREAGFTGGVVSEAGDAQT